MQKTKGFDGVFSLAIFELSRINNFENCYQQNIFSKYLKKRIWIQDREIRLYLQINKILFYLITKVLTLWKGYACIQLRFNISMVRQQLNTCLLYLKKIWLHIFANVFFPECWYSWICLYIINNICVVFGGLGFNRDLAFQWTLNVIPFCPTYSCICLRHLSG